MRGFFAFGVELEFSLELRKTIVNFPADPGFKLLLPADYHVTIKFLSEFSSTDFFACLDELCELGRPPANALRAGKLALWPTVLALECTPSEELKIWHGKVNALLERKGFIKERHPLFHPHITLARRKMGSKSSGVIAHLQSVENIFNGRLVPLTAAALWKSQAEETGRRHQELLSLIFQ
ncbi:MAG: 2'-5' RNA ligase family protein [Bdellovibrionota bacterium]